MGLAARLSALYEHNCAMDADLFESIRAGLPEQASEDSSSVVTIDRCLIARPSKTSLVRVKGESMKDAGILAGDLAVIEWRTSAKVGDVVAAVVDGELTLKYLARDKGGYYLQPANEAYSPIHAKGRLEISGECGGDGEIAIVCIAVAHAFDMPVNANNFLNDHQASARTPFRVAVERQAGSRIDDAA